MYKTTFLAGFLLISTITLTALYNSPKVTTGEIFVPLEETRTEFCVHLFPGTENWGVQEAIKVWSDPRSKVNYTLAPDCPIPSIPVNVITGGNKDCKTYAGLAGRHALYREVNLNEKCNYPYKTKYLVSLHEFGHVSGIDHTTKTKDIMNANPWPNPHFKDYLYGMTHG
mgnify:CR=1 FL=1